MRAAVVVVLLCGTAAADPGEADRLFREGRRLLDAGRAAEACPMFEKSQELDPGRGTLINLAACYEAVGRLRDALRVFREVEAQSKAARDTARLEAARKRIDGIEARIPRVTIDAPAGVVVMVNGEEVEGEIIVDPGRIAIVARAEGHEEWATEIDVLAGERETVQVPELEVVPIEAPVEAAPVVVERRRERRRVIAGIATAGGGAVMLGASVVIAARAKGDWDAAVREACGGDPRACTVEGVERTRDARRWGDVATIVGGIGIGAIAAGAVLWWTAPVEVRPQVSADGAGVSVLGRF